MAFLGGRKRNEEEEEDEREMGTKDVTILHQAAKMFGLEEQVQRKQRTGKAVDHVPPAQARAGWEGPWGRCTAAPKLLLLLTLHF